MKCSICNKDFEGYGNNAQPVNDGVCCDDCNVMVITRRLFDMQIPFRILLMNHFKILKI